jgi:hypothetical protein
MWAPLSIGIHGLTAIVENTSWTVRRTGLAGVITPSHTDLEGWILFPIPTPLISSTGQRVKVVNISLECRMGQQTHITTVHLRDGQNLIANFDELGICDATLKKRSWEVEGTPVVESALAICVFATFDVAPQGAAGTWIEIVSVGLEFAIDEERNVSTLERDTGEKISE